MIFLLNVLRKQVCNMKLAFEEQTKSTLDQLLEEEHENLTLVTNHEEANYVIEQIKKLQLQKKMSKSKRLDILTKLKIKLICLKNNN